MLFREHIPCISWLLLQFLIYRECICAIGACECGSRMLPYNRILLLLTVEESPLAFHILVLMPCPLRFFWFPYCRSIIQVFRLTDFYSFPFFEIHLVVVWHFHFSWFCYIVARCCAVPWWVIDYPMLASPIVCTAQDQFKFTPSTC